MCYEKVRRTQKKVPVLVSIFGKVEYLFPKVAYPWELSVSCLIKSKKETRTAASDNFMMKVNNTNNGVICFIGPRTMLVVLISLLSTLNIFRTLNGVFWRLFENSDILYFFTFEQVLAHSVQRRIQNNLRQTSKMKLFAKIINRWKNEECSTKNVL